MNEVGAVETEAVSFDEGEISEEMRIWAIVIDCTLRKIAVNRQMNGTPQTPKAVRKHFWKKYFSHFAKDVMAMKKLSHV